MQTLKYHGRRGRYACFDSCKIVLTPHPKELQRLIGTWENDFEKLEKVKVFSQKYNCIVLIKGMHTAVVLPNQEVHFNSTGNPGMATGGSGDVLTGMITALIAQGYSSEEAAIIGVFKHGEAGDIASQERGQMAMLPSDIIEKLRW
jgi:NAD(P)H-hydrate epimerase